MIEIKAIDHIVLRTKSTQAMLDFYCGVLGCQVERVLDDLGLTQLRAGSSIIDIVAVDSELGRQGGDAPTASGNNLDHFCLQIAPVNHDQLLCYLKERNIDVGEFSNRYGAQGFGPSIYIKDPENNIVELKEISE